MNTEISKLNLNYQDYMRWMICTKWGCLIMREGSIYEGGRLYLETDDRLKLGDERLEHTNPEAKAYFDEIMRNKKQFLEQFKIRK